MKIQRKIELLAPAKNLECGIAAIDQGADAVYIGAPAFSARSAAGNSIEDIRQLADYAHVFHAKVYVALNTILRDGELETAERLIYEIYQAGADALIIQDMGILEMDLPPIAIHASTQCDNRSLEKVQFLEQAGCSQVVLARELSLEEIRNIAGHTQVALEVFIHGALCVCYSGQCYISQALSGRSANRGECAQYCRLPYTLQDADGTVILKDKHLLSLRDMNQTAHIEKLLDAGVTSLKIEGRLKDVSYVKNITAHYRQQLDEIFSRRPEYTAASSGISTHFFAPNPDKSFNRGFTDYFLHGRNSALASFDTPKSLGEQIGTVKDLKGNCFSYTKQKQVNNGDGLCFLNENKELQGFRVNRAEGDRIYPAEMPRLNPGVILYRNYDHEFEKLLARKTAERKIRIDFALTENNFGFTLTASDEDNNTASVSIPFGKEISERDQKENIRTQLSKLGNTPYSIGIINIELSDKWFIPSSILSESRRRAIESLTSVRKIAFPRTRKKVEPTNHPYIKDSLSYLGNVSNEKARAFYSRHGVQSIAPALETGATAQGPLMFTRYCLRYQLGLCPSKQNPDKKWKEPLSLLSGSHRLSLQFDCRNCEMKIS